MNINVSKLSRAEVAGQPNLRAFAEIRVGEITICDCRIIQQPGQKAYVTGPQKQVGSNFYPIVRMSTALRDQVQSIVIQAAMRANLVTCPAILPDNSQHRDAELGLGLPHEHSTGTH